MMASNSNQYTHSKQLFACSISSKSTIDHQKVILGSLGPGNQQIICLQSSPDGFKSKQYQLGNSISMKLQFLPSIEESERFISGGEKLSIYKCDDQKFSHIADLIPLSKEYNGPTSGFDFHYKQSNRLISCSVDPSIRIWDLEKKKCSQQYTIDDTESNPDIYSIDISLSKDPEVFAFLNNLHQICIFDLRLKEGINKIKGKLSYNQILWNKETDQHMAAVDSDTNVIDLYDMRQTNNKYHRIRTDHGYTSRAEWFYQRNALVTAGLDKQIILYEGEKMDPQLSLTKQYPVENLCCYEDLFGVISENTFEIFHFDKF